MSEGSPGGSALVAAVVVAVAGAIVFTSYELSKDRIAANDRARVVRSLVSVLEPTIAAREPAIVRLEAVDRELLGSDAPVDVFVAIDAGVPVAAIIASVADGYNTSINLLVGISSDGRLSGVRALEHRETPGLGDRIDAAKSPWIEQFKGLSLTAPPLPAWAVDKDEGQFDSLTGATVTSRAVVKAVRDTLLYFERHRDELFSRALTEKPADAAD